MRLIAFASVAMLLLVRPDVALAQPCRPVSHQQLEALLPSLPKEFSRGTPNGETDTQEAVSRTTVDYENRATAAVISVELMDTCRNSDMLSQLREFLKTGPPATPGTAFRSVPVQGFPAYEEWTAPSKHTEIHVLVADRFMVKVTGDLVDLGQVQNAAQAIDFKKLAALR